ncbi:MAG TPA: cysteine methyltransferase [Bacteroidales bacterium]|jgi:AraC family transcriptional regulator of adaptative response/methylated-DNA-[protein]-cysteine methyltransferase|nr:cysteine methyltransferase [Bacteroidales bacterium]
MQLIKSKQPTLFDAANQKGLSETNRLYQPVIRIEPMTLDELENGGANLSISYSFAESPFGEVIIASTQKGICYLAFLDDEEEGFADLRSRFPNAHYNHVVDDIQQNALLIFQPNLSTTEIILHLNGTPFQLKIWETLLKIPMGYLSTYGEIAKEIESPSASRAVGTAIGKNPIAFIVPCHRVIQASGNIGGYMWGSARKSIIIDWEAAKL